MDTLTTPYKHCDLVKVTGRIDSATAPQFADSLNALVESGRYKIALEMSGVDFISSAGLRVLINIQKSCKRYNRGELVLVSVPAKIYAALDLAGFTTLFRFFDDVLTAVGNL